MLQETASWQLSPGCLSLLAPGGTMGRFAKTWLRPWSHCPWGLIEDMQGGPGAAQKLFYKMLNLRVFIRMIFSAKISEALTKEKHWAFQLSPELNKRKVMGEEVNEVFNKITFHLLTQVNGITPKIQAPLKQGVYLWEVCGITMKEAVYQPCTLLQPLTWSSEGCSQDFIILHAIDAAASGLTQ